MNVIGNFFINEICAPNKLKLLFDKTPIVVLLKLSQIKCHVQKISTWFVSCESPDDYEGEPVEVIPVDG